MYSYKTPNYTKINGTMHARNYQKGSQTVRMDGWTENLGNKGNIDL